MAKPDIRKLQGKKKVKAIIKALQHTDLSIRADAAKALGVLDEKSASEPLIKTLREHSKALKEKKDNEDKTTIYRVCIAIINALGKLKEKKAIPIILEFQKLHQYFQTPSLVYDKSYAYELIKALMELNVYDEIMELRNGTYGYVNLDIKNEIKKNWDYILIGSGDKNMIEKAILDYQNLSVLHGYISGNYVQGNVAVNFRQKNNLASEAFKQINPPYDKKIINAMLEIIAVARFFSEHSDSTISIYNSSLVRTGEDALSQVELIPLLNEISNESSALIGKEKKNYLERISTYDPLGTKARINNEKVRKEKRLLIETILNKIQKKKSEEKNEKISYTFKKKIKIEELNHYVSSIVMDFYEKGIPNDTVFKLIEKMLIATCPKCGSEYRGGALLITPDMPEYNPGAILAQGRCVCGGKELIFCVKEV